MLREVYIFPFPHSAYQLFSIHFIPIISAGQFLFISFLIHQSPVDFSFPTAFLIFNMHYSKVVALTLLGAASANPYAYHDNEDLDIFTRDVDNYYDALIAREAEAEAEAFFDEGDFELNARDALFDDDDDFYLALARRAKGASKSSSSGSKSSSSSSGKTDWTAKVQKDSGYKPGQEKKQSFWSKLTHKEPKSSTSHLEGLAAKQAKGAFGMTRTEADHNKISEKKAGIWNHQHQNQVQQADGKTKIYNEKMKVIITAFAKRTSLTNQFKIGDKGCHGRYQYRRRIDETPHSRSSPPCVDRSDLRRALRVLEQTIMYITHDTFYFICGSGHLSAVIP